MLQVETYSCKSDFNPPILEDFVPRYVQKSKPDIPPFMRSIQILFLLILNIICYNLLPSSSSRYLQIAGSRPTSIDEMMFWTIPVKMTINSPPHTITLSLKQLVILDILKVHNWSRSFMLKQEHDTIVICHEYVVFLFMEAGNIDYLTCHVCQLGLNKWILQFCILQENLTGFIASKGLILSFYAQFAHLSLFLCSVRISIGSISYSLIALYPSLLFLSTLTHMEHTPPSSSSSYYNR